MMNKTNFLLCIIGLAGAIVITGFYHTADKAKDPVDYVDPLIGTTKAGNVYPAVGAPFGMTQWTPQTVTPAIKGNSPYRYYDPAIQGFRGSHWLSGGATQDYGSFTVMPVTGELKVYPQARSSDFDHNEEVAKPDYYKVKLKDYNIDAEVTGTIRSGLLRFTFPKTDSSYIIIDTNAAYEPTKKNTEGDGSIIIDPENQLIAGFNPAYRMYQGWGKPAGFSGYFVAKFNKPFVAYGTWNHGQPPNLGSKEASDRPGAFIRFHTGEKESIEVKIGTSFTSIEEAKRNLDKEIPGWNFESVREQAHQKWNTNLAKIRIEGGTEDQKTNFYTSLYHTLLLPRVFSDEDGTYPEFASDNTLQKAKDREQYADFSLWDTFRAVHPLFTIIEPERTNDMITSLISKGEQGDFLPIYPAWDNFTSEMIGDHATSMIVDAYMKGIRDFDVEKAYDLMYKNATTLPESYQEYADGKGRRALDTYKDMGYIPLEDSVKEAFHKGEQVSRTLEYAYDDWALAQMANGMDKIENYKLLIQRAQNYKNVFDKSTGFVRGRYEDSSWVKPFNSAQTASYITEGTPYQYTWFVPHDVEGLIKLMGGRKKFTAKLDAFFERASRLYPSFRTNPYYWHGNEPDHHSVYLFCYAGAPWKTQKWVREILNRSYKANPGGLSGNDDAGQMSAWYVFSAMGFYPVTPGNPSYVMGSPIFDKITIDAGNGNHFVVKTINNSKKNRYIQSASLNGKTWQKPWITHADIMKGKTLVLKMGPEPNKNWGASTNQAPPSMNEKVGKFNIHK